MDNGAGSAKRSPIEQAFDVFVYAPLGLALEARSLMPRLVERGRSQVMMAKMIGQFAVRAGQSETGKALGKAGEQASAVLTDLGLLARATDAAEPASSAPAAAAATVAPVRPEPAVSEPPLSEPVAEAVAAPEPVIEPAIDADVDLAIADFDSLAASQVIPRLPGLSSAELEAVRNYEAVHRGRKTVLNRIAQLQSA